MDALGNKYNLQYNLKGSTTSTNFASANTFSREAKQPEEIRVICLDFDSHA